MKIGSVLGTIGVTTVFVSVASVGLGRFSRYRHDKRKMNTENIKEFVSDKLEIKNMAIKNVDFFDFNTLYGKIKNVRDYSLKNIALNNENNLNMIKKIKQK